MPSEWPFSAYQYIWQWSLSSQSKASPARHCIRAREPTFWKPPSHPGHRVTPFSSCHSSPALYRQNSVFGGSWQAEIGSLRKPLLDLAEHAENCSAHHPCFMSRPAGPQGVHSLCEGSFPPWRCLSCSVLHRYFQPGSVKWARNVSERGRRLETASYKQRSALTKLGSPEALTCI